LQNKNIGLSNWVEFRIWHGIRLFRAQRASAVCSEGENNQARAEQTTRNMKNLKLSLGVLLAGIVMLANQAAATPPAPQDVPDGGSTVALLTMAMLGIGVVRRFLGRNNR
jgi:hypothetical protein